MAVDRRATRLGVLALVGISLFSLLGVRLWFLQTVKAEELQEVVDVAKRRIVRTAPERGRIFDIDGRILADNERVLTVAVDWQQLRRKTQREEIFTRLSGWVQVPVEAMEARFQRQIDSPFLPFPIKQGVDEPTAGAILERIEDFPGVSIEVEWKRVYPYAPHAAHVIGYMGALTEENVEDPQYEGYLLNERVGQFGVEKSMEPVLHGVWGYKEIEVDAANRPVRIIKEVPPVNGFDVQLTIDLDAQQYAEQTIETTLRARRTQTAPNPVVLKPDGSREPMDITQGEEVPYKAPAASAVVMNYETGDVIALASYPTFDNRWFEAGLSSTKFQQIFPVTDDPDKSILVNRAVQGRYNLGSTFKPFTAYAALNTGLISPGERYDDRGTYTLGPESADQARCKAGLIKCEYKNATCGGTGRPCVYGSVNVEDALAVSSDTFFYRIGENIMIRNDRAPILQAEVERFGFGADTGIELPFEFDGTVPDRELKRLYAERGVISEDEGRSYYVGDNVQLAIGQGLLSATPLQLATAYGTLANYGFVHRPTIIEAIWEPGVPDGDTPGFVDFSRGTIFDDRSGPDLARQIPMPDDIRRPIVAGLRRVVTGPGVDSDYYHKTTGEHLFLDYPDTAIPLAGKTGTAQGANNYPWNDSSVFTGFAIDPSTDAYEPNDEHPYVVTAYLEKAGYGSQAAAPVVKCIFLALSDPTRMDPVQLAEPLDLGATVAAQPMSMPGADLLPDIGPPCWNSRFGSGVLTQERAVE
jgi:penicillin-binding protein 2